MSAIGVVAAVGVATAVTWSMMTLPTSRGAAAAPSSPPGTSAPAATSKPRPMTPSERLLASTNDPRACAVSFVGEGIDLAPALQVTGTLYTSLPIPVRESAVFAGWYASARDAADLTVEARLNGADMVTCDESERTLHGAWVSPERHAAEDARIPILMYHQFTPRPEGEDHWLRGNYAYIGDFDDHMAYIATSGFYLPTWDELSAFIDGEILLPSRSVIVTDDDADQTWFDLAVPVVDEHEVLATSFMVTAWRQDPPPSPYVLRRSHTHDMHRAGANGDGRIVNEGVDVVAADMTTSADILGVAEVMAYPFGHHNETAKQGLRDAGFEMARTIEHGYVTVGTDKLALPTIRIDYGMGLDALIARIG